MCCPLIIQKQTAYPAAAVDGKTACQGRQDRIGSDLYGVNESCSESGFAVDGNDDMNLLVGIQEKRKK